MTLEPPYRMCFPTLEPCLKSRLVLVANRLPSISCAYLMYKSQCHDSH